MRKYLRNFPTSVTITETIQKNYISLEKLLTLLQWEQNGLTPIMSKIHFRPVRVDWYKRKMFSKSGWNRSLRGLGRTEMEKGTDIDRDFHINIFVGINRTLRWTDVLYFNLVMYTSAFFAVRGRRVINQRKMLQCSNQQNNARVLQGIKRQPKEKHRIVAIIRLFNWFARASKLLPLRLFGSRVVHYAMQKKQQRETQHTQHTALAKKAQWHVREQMHKKKKKRKKIK